MSPIMQPIMILTAALSAGWLVWNLGRRGQLKRVIHKSSALVPETSSFDGKRWLRRRAGFDASKFQLASTAEDAFDWGGAPHACPGRFMAEITIRLILIFLVTRYDMKLPEVGPEQPAESRRFMDLAPDTSMPVLLRDVQE